MIKKGIIYSVLMLFCLLLATESAVYADGISVDAGLTPPKDRWIFRTQLRFMGQNNAAMENEMDMVAWNNILAYGLLSKLTVMIRQPVMWQTMTMAGMEARSWGAGNLGIMAKYGIYRRNTPNSVLGAAILVGADIPTGSDEVTANTWTLKPGVYLSWRGRPWAADLSFVYKFNSTAGDSQPGFDPGDELSLDMSLSYQFSFGEQARVALAPVLEFSFLRKFPDGTGEGSDASEESVLFLSPGIKLVLSSFIIESLIQIPAWQEEKATQLKRGTAFIFGIRILF